MTLALFLGFGTYVQLHSCWFEIVHTSTLVAGMRWARHGEIGQFGPTSQLLFSFCIPPQFHQYVPIVNATEIVFLVGQYPTRNTISTFYKLEETQLSALRVSSGICAQHAHIYRGLGAGGIPPLKDHLKTLTVCALSPPMPFYKLLISLNFIFLGEALPFHGHL